jgi:hypothetical protein
MPPVARRDAGEIAKELRKIYTAANADAALDALAAFSAAEWGLKYPEDPGRSRSSGPAAPARAQRRRTPDTMAAWPAWFDSMGESLSDRGNPVFESTELGDCREGTRLGATASSTPRTSSPPSHWPRDLRPCRQAAASRSASSPCSTSTPLERPRVSADASRSQITKRSFQASFFNYVPADAFGLAHRRKPPAGWISSPAGSRRCHVRGHSVKTELVALDVLHHDARLVVVIGRQ